VIYYLNFSSNRKNPILRTAKITNDEEQMWQLYDSWINDETISKRGGLIKGWVLESSLDVREKKRKKN
jgi:hypothetical protein